MNPTLTLSEQYLFNSAFEGGNLDCVVKVAQTEFDLFLRVDSNTHGHTGWYYFSICNGNRKGTITLNLCNLRRVSPLYQQGMSPFVYSQKSSGQGGQWSQGCSNIRFQLTPLRYDIIYQRTDYPNLYRLSFDYNFQHQNDEVFFAYCIPYSYSRLQLDIQQYCNSPFVQYYSLGQSLSGLEIPLLHVTQPNQDNQQTKHCVVVTARVHPCESNSSFLLRGLLQQLLSSSKSSQRHTHFFLIPMLNPDGVVLGNTRTSAAGVDLNRQFLETQPEMHPEVHQLKNLVARLQKNSKVTLYLDLHGHSRRKNTFAYGPNYSLAHPQYLRSRMLPKIIQKINQEFRYYSCSFTISQQKTKTARSTMIHQLRVPYVYTIETSAGLYYSPELMKTLAFKAQNWLEMGMGITKGIAVLISAMIEFQTLIKQRRMERDRRKDKQSPNKSKYQFSQDQFQFCKPKEARASLYLDLITQIKQTTNSTKTFQDPTDSDDYDLCEDLTGPSLKEFKILVTGYRQQYSPNKYVATIQQEEDNFKVPIPELPITDLENLSEQQEKKGPICKSPRRVFKEQFRATTKTIKTIDLVASKKQFGNKMKTRNSVHQIESKTHIVKRETAPISVYPPKPRYSLIPKNIYPLQEKFQALSMPKNLKIMRKEMKKGRLLISSLEESRRKFMAGHQYQTTPEQSLKKKPSLLNASRTRPALRSSTTHISGTVNLNEQVRLKPSQPYLHGLDNYVCLTGIDTDKLAITITNYKRRH